jgi:hypothetical protein
MRKAYIFMTALLLCFILTACAPNILPGPSIAAPQPTLEAGMERYSPLMSSVPGYPFTCKRENVASVTYITDNGGMLLWGPDDFKVKPQGKQVSVKAEETVYWSPLTDGQDMAAKASITVTIRMEDGRETARHIAIEAEDGSAYYRAAVTN